MNRTHTQFAAVSAVIILISTAALIAAFRPAADIHTDTAGKPLEPSYITGNPSTITVQRFFTPAKDTTQNTPAGNAAKKESTSYTLQLTNNIWHLAGYPDIPIQQPAAQQLALACSHITLLRILTPDEYKNIQSSGFLPSDETYDAAFFITGTDGSKTAIRFLRAMPDTTGWYAAVTCGSQTVTGIISTDLYTLTGFTAETLQTPPELHLPPPNTGCTATITTETKPVTADTLNTEQTDTLLANLQDLRYARIVLDTAALMPPVIQKTADIQPPPGTRSAVTVTKYAPYRDRLTGETYDLYTVSSAPAVLYRILPVYSPLK